MLTYVRWYWPDDDSWNYDELDADRWALRHVELRGSDGAFLAAASLAEVLIARDSSTPGAVTRYEQRYGIMPEAPIPPPDPIVEPALESVPSEEFEHLWRDARRHLEQQTSAERLGHENATVDLSTYGHLMPDSEERTRRAVDDAWGCAPDVPQGDGSTG
ncbi:hypothetical protein AB0869_09925 [Micromonospora vinacea]|uniref:hypothetical protein n=1 Tax=Micromonospora vinacea TaxID=709878 RepID=UPI003455145A